ncbi:MAG: hypothetical protein DRH04_08345, partial [Deltaproteobacteria bacterium]
GQLAKIGKQLGIYIDSMKEYNELMKVGAIVRDDATGKLKIHRDAYTAYHAGLLKVEDVEKKVAKAVSKTAAEMVAASTAQNTAQIALDKFINGLPKASEGVTTYAIKVADLKLALATGTKSQEEFNQQMLELNQQHWADEVKILSDSLAETKKKLDAGKIKYAEYETAVLKLREAQLNLADATGKSTSAADKAAQMYDTVEERLGLVAAGTLEVGEELVLVNGKWVAAGDAAAAASDQMFDAGDIGEEAGRRAGSTAGAAEQAWQN